MSVRLKTCAAHTTRRRLSWGCLVLFGWILITSPRAAFAQSVNVWTGGMNAQLYTRKARIEASRAA